MDLIPGKLSWLPCVAHEKRVDGDCCVFALEDYIDDDSLRGGRYSVVHYGSKVLGRAFGPLALDQTIRFCSVMDTLLKKFKHVVVLKTQDPRETANLAVLLGAFLLLQRFWSVEDVADRLPEEARLSFNISWAKASAPASLLTVRDCWSGLQMAREQKWLDLSSFDDVLKVRLLCTMYHMILLRYDAAWLVPGKVLVSADPVSTIHDPNPATCRALTGNLEREESSLSVCRVDSQRFRESQTTGSKERLGPERTDFSSDEPSVTVLTTHTVVKEYEVDLQRAHPIVASSEALDFVSWLKGLGVGHVVRVNDGNETGLKHLGGTYDKTLFTFAGITHLDTPTPDVGGAVPDSDTVRRVLTSCERVMDTSVILLHCKGWILTLCLFFSKGK